MPDSDLVSLTEATSLDANDILYVVTDPAGTPADKKVKVSNLPAGGGTSWDLVVDQDGSSATNWTNYSPNTVSSSGGEFVCSSSSNPAVFAYTAAILGSFCVLEAEVQFVSFGGAVSQIGIGAANSGATVTNIITTVAGDGSSAQVRTNRFFVGGGGSVGIANISTGVWYTLRVERAGSVWTIYVDGTAIATIECPFADNVLSYLALTAYEAQAKWRNVKAWNLGLPT